MKIGDKVKLKFHPDYITGTISDFRDHETYGYQWYVAFTRDDLIPSGDWYREEYLDKLDGEVGTQLAFDLGCECGQTDEPWVKHSEYCPLYGRRR